jgi:Heavy metal binding domain
MLLVSACYKEDAMKDSKSTDNNDRGKLGRSKQPLLGRRDIMKLGAGAAVVGIVKVPAVFGRAQNTIYTNNGYAETTPPVDPTAQQATDTVYVCPMDPDVRSNQPGVCPRCGMTLVAGIPDYSSEYKLILTVTPRAPKVGQIARLDFAILDPWKNRQVKQYQVVHEKLFHMFLVSQDLEFFIHDHPVLNSDGTFTYNFKVPKPGMFRLLADIYPLGGTPQLIAKTLFVPGAAPVSAPGLLPGDYTPKDTENMHVEFSSDPGQPIAGMKSILYYHVSPTDGFEQYLGAWAHMLAVSDDLIDLIHSHPTNADGGPELQFNLIFPRNRTYRIWTQFQRKGVVNTSRFDVPLRSLDQL